MKLNQKGFSGSEFVIVIFIIVSLIGGSIPLFFYLQKKSRLQYFKNYVSSLQTSIEAWHASGLLNNNDSWPAKLDNQKFPATCSSCFSLLNKGLDDKLWLKISEKEYTFLPASLRLTYDSETGIINTFGKTK